ncbi:hypothetical protein B0H17DRAFT_314424 [Mycena rosella]|uniref:C2H2-type domain-containing protein n=1 Tax=Mycena rosella TaxID=1033263 RepID=A0AAD7CTE7_MYCRO|nr:hypothetical protein B0H17DRAFT_314424 [Mycena rosella]
MPACCDKCQGPRDKSCGEKHRPFQIKVNWQPRFTAEARNYEFDRASDPLECPLGCKKTWAQYGRYISITRHIKRAHKEIVLNASASTSSTISLAYVAVPMESSYEALSAELRATETDSLPSPNEPKPKRVVKSAHKRRLIVSDEESDGNSGISRSVDFAGAHKRRIIVSDEESDDNGGISRFLSFKNDGEQGSAGASDEGRRRTSRTSSPNGVIIVPRQPAVSRARIRKPVESNQVLDQVQSSPGRLGPWPSPLLGPHAENDQCSPNSGRRTVSPLPQSLSPRTPGTISI